MTKEKLERIKEAYYSGLKVQIWFCGHWENFDARDYSMYSDPFSEHRQYRIVGSAYADIAEKRIKELEEKLAGAERIRDNLIQLGFPTFQSCKEYADEMNFAKSIIKGLLDNSDEYARQRAEDFLKGEKN